MMRQVRGVAAALALLLLAGCGGDPAEETPAVSGTEPPAGEITLYGEIHGNAAIKEYEAERWKECYDQGMRHLLWSSPTTRPSGSTCGWMRRTTGSWSSSASYSLMAALPWISP